MILAHNQANLTLLRQKLRKEKRETGRKVRGRVVAGEEQRSGSVFPSRCSLTQQIFTFGLAVSLIRC